MKKNIPRAALLASSVFTLFALAPSMASARSGIGPGSYSLGGIQDVCLLAGGTWYGETFPGWGGTWFKGPTNQFATVIFGNFDSGAGSDSIIVSRGLANWMDWDTTDSYYEFLYDLPVTPTPGKCTPPAAGPPKPGRHHPMD